MTDDELRGLVQQQARVIEQLQGQLGLRNAEQTKVIDINDHRVPYTFRGFPSTLYRAQADPNPNQVDHPGFDSLIVKNQVEADARIAEGWSPTMEAPEPADGDDDQAVTPKPAKPAKSAAPRAPKPPKPAKADKDEKAE